MGETYKIFVASKDGSSMYDLYAENEEEERDIKNDNSIELVFSLKEDNNNNLNPLANHEDIFHKASRITIHFNAIEILDYFLLNFQHIYMKFLII